MSNVKWAVIRKRVYLSLPYLQALLVAYGLTSDAKAALWVGLVGVIIGPVVGHTAAKNVDYERAREKDTLIISDVNPYEAGTDEYHMREYGFIPTSEDKPIPGPVKPCHKMHGAAESHVRGCEGWTSEPS